MNYAKHYDLLIQKHGSRSKPESYSERHHIVPKCLGGTDEESNLVYLSAEAHYVAHQLLVKMNPGDYKLSYSAFMMTRATSQTVRSNKLYGWLKKEFSTTCSNFQKARFSNKSNHPCFGKLGEHHPRYGTGKHQKKEGYVRENPTKRGSDEYKLKLSAIRKVAFLGEKNPAYGTKMINNGMIRKRIPKDLPVPDGWVLGAVLNKERIK